MNLSMFANSSTDTGITGHMTHVACRLSLTPTVKATDPPLKVLSEMEFCQNWIIVRNLFFSNVEFCQKFSFVINKNILQIFFILILGKDLTSASYLFILHLKGHFLRQSNDPTLFV